MIGEALVLGLFTNAIYDIIKGTVKQIFTTDSDELGVKVCLAIEAASKKFFDKYQMEFGEANSSFLARQSNVELIVKSIFYGSNIKLMNDISREGFDGSKEVSGEALAYFIKELEQVMMEDFELNKIITEKTNMNTTNLKLDKIIDLINNNDQAKNDTSFNNWKITDEFGNTTDLEEGKLYDIGYKNGLRYQYMFKEGLVYLEILDTNGQTTYYEVDMNGNVKDIKFPYDVSEYVLKISPEQIIHIDRIYINADYRKEIIKLKWNKKIEVIYNSEDKIQWFSAHGGWAIKHNEKTICPN